MNTLGITHRLHLACFYATNISTSFVVAKKKNVFSAGRHPNVDILSSSGPMLSLFIPIKEDALSIPVGLPYSRKKESAPICRCRFSDAPFDTGLSVQQV